MFNWLFKKKHLIKNSQQFTTQDMWFLGQAAGLEVKVFCSFGNPCEEQVVGEIAVDQLPDGNYTMLPICQYHKDKVAAAAGLTSENN